MVTQTAKVQRKAKSDHGNGSSGAPFKSPIKGNPSQSGGTRLSSFYSYGPAVSLAVPVQRKVTIGQPNDPYEREANAVADRVTAGHQISSISHIPPGGLAGVAQRQEEENKTVQELSLQREDEKKEPVQELSIQKQDDEKEGSVQELALQRQDEQEEEPAGEASVQKQEEEKDTSVQELSIQRQEEEKEERVETLPLQRKEDEEPVQELKVQRQGEEEEKPVQELSIQRQEDKEESVQERAIQKEEDEKESVQSMIQRQDDEEPVQGSMIQREGADKEEQVQESGIQRQEEEDKSVQEVSIQREAEEAEEEEESDDVQTLVLQRQGDNEESVQEQAIQLDDNEDESSVQSKSSIGSGVTGAMKSAASHAIHTKCAGEPLNFGTRHKLESSIGVDLSDVRVHEDSSAHKTSADLKAKAFTHKNHIWLGQGQTQSDIRLMAHETTHVLQQGGVVRRKPLPISSVSPRIQGGWLSDAWGAVKKAGSKVAAVGKAVVKGATELAAGAKEWALKKVAAHAHKIPGFHLLTFIIGRNPITNKAVARNAMNLTRGIMSLVPGGDKLFKNLKESGALERAFEWFSKQIEKLNITWTVIKELFQKAWDSLSASDLLSPLKAFAKIKKIFMPPIIRIKNFALAVGKKVLEFIFEGALRLAGPAGKKIMNVIRKGKETFRLIVSDPIGFLSNLLKAVGQGFKQFSANIWTHLKKGLLGWLFGTLSKAGITMPEKFDLKGILSLVLQILNLTYDNIRGKLVKHLGEPTVKFLEKAFEFVKILVTEGLAGVWKKILEYMGNLKDMVIGAIRNWVVTTIIKSAITKLATMFNPVGAIIQAIITIYNTVMFFIERAKQIAELANAVFDSIINIAKGKLKAAANYVELTMARTIPVIISFLARLLGLGGIAGKIQDVIKKIQKKVNKALDKVVGFIVKKAKKLFGKGKALARKGIEKVKELLFPKKSFKAGGETHAVEAKKSGKGHIIVVRSNTMTITQVITKARNDPTLKKDTNFQKNKVKVLADEYNNWLKMKVDTEQRRKAKSHKYQEIFELTTAIMKKLPIATATPARVSSITWDTDTSKRPSKVEASPLTAKGPAGGKPGDVIPGWKSGTPSQKTKSAYRLHLLHHKLHGPGRAFNLVPGSKDMNELMKNVELPTVRALGLDKKTSVKQDYVELKYTVTVGYGTPPGKLEKTVAKWIKIKEVTGKNLATNAKIKIPGVTTPDNF